MRLHFLSVVCVVAVGCGTGGTQCREVVDAGSSPRALGEPCGDQVVGCDPGLTCANVRLNTIQQQCVSACGGDAGTCGGGRGCLNGQCVPTCTVPSDCPGRFVSKCEPTDAGVGLCIAVSCSVGEACPSGTCAQTAPYCCPPGAPCVAPPPGVCLR